MTLHWWMHWFWVTLWFTVITGIPLPSKIRDTTTITAVDTIDAATTSLISKYKSNYLTTFKYPNTESVTELFKESSSTSTLSTLSYVKNDNNLSITTSAPNTHVNPLPTPSSLILLSSSSLKENNNRVSKSIAGINNNAAVPVSLSEAFEINNNNNNNNNNKAKEVKDEYDNPNINKNNKNNITVLNNNNNNNDYRVDREANDNSRDTKNKNSPASVLKNNFEESLDGVNSGISSSIIIIPSKNQYNINISSSNYTNDNINLNLNNNNNNNNNRTSSLSSNRSLSLIKKKDSKVTWLLTGNKTSPSLSRNEKLIINTAEEDEHRKNSSLNNNNDDGDNDDDNLAVLPLQEPIPTRFKLVLNRTKFIPSININNNDNFNDNYNDNDKLLNKSEDVEIRGDNIDDTRLLATAASILQGVSESPRLSRARSAFPGDYQQDEQQEQRQVKMSEKNGFGNTTNSSAMDIAAVTGSCLATVVLIGTMGSLGFIMYRRRYMNPPQTLNSDKCSNPDSSGYIDDSTIRDNSEEMYSLDNDSFLNSLEAMTIQNYWTDSVKHTKL